MARPLGRRVFQLLKNLDMQLLGEPAEGLLGAHRREMKACNSHESLDVNVDSGFSASPTWEAARPFFSGRAV